MPQESAAQVSVIQTEYVGMSVPMMRSWVIFHLLTRATAVYVMRYVNFSLLFLIHLQVHSTFVFGVWGLSASFSRYHIRVGCKYSLIVPTYFISVSPSLLKKHKMVYQLDRIFPVESNADISGKLKCIWEKGVLYLLP